jgi:heme exporter protein CcmD
MELFAMGEYGAYVWSSFGLTLIVLIVCVVQARRRHRKTISDIRLRLRAMETIE